MLDILFVGTDLDENGDPVPASQVLALASRDGIEQLQRVFPGTPISWKPLDEFRGWATELPGWRECCIKVKDIISGEIDVPHKLPERLIKLVPVDFLSKNQLAFMCMSAVNDLHGRAAMLDEDMDILQVQLPDHTQFTKH